MSKITLEEYFPDSKSGSDTKNFITSFLFIIALLFAGFYYLSTVEILPEPVQEKLTTLKTTFSINQEKKEVIKPKPIDLGEKPNIVPVDEIPKDVSEAKPENSEVKKVYGLQKVYATGLGAGGTMADAVVGKFGNTINKDFDTVTASQADLVAKEIAASSSVTQAPSFKKRVIPQISEEIRKSGVSGTVRVKILVDIDGKVKKAVAQNDLGFGTVQSAVEACLQMEFTPAKIGDEIVAVWITIPVRFEKL